MGLFLTAYAIPLESNSEDEQIRACLKKINPNWPYKTKGAGKDCGNSVDNPQYGSCMLDNMPQGIDDTAVKYADECIAQVTKTGSGSQSVPGQSLKPLEDVGFKVTHADPKPSKANTNPNPSKGPLNLKPAAGSVSPEQKNEVKLRSPSATFTIQYPAGPTHQSQAPPPDLWPNTNKFFDDATIADWGYSD